MQPKLPVQSAADLVLEAAIPESRRYLDPAANKDQQKPFCICRWRCKLYVKDD